MKKTLDKKSSVPLYQQLAELFKDKILDGTLYPGYLMPSENDLAKEYSVSRMTARATLKLLEDESLLSCNSTRGRIVENSKNALPLQSGSSEAVIGTYPFRDYYYDGMYFSEILDGVSEAALKNRVKLKFLSEKTVMSESSNLKEHLYKNKIDALINIPKNDFNLDGTRDLEENGFKTIAFNIDLTGSGFNFITCNHYNGVSMLMDSLCHMGHKKIACVNYNTKKYPLADKMRWQAYRDAHNRYKLKFHKDFTIEINSFNVPNAIKEEIDKKLEDLFRKKERPSAILISRGSFVEKTIEKLFEMGFSVPDDVSVVSFDKMPLPSSMPQVTCVKQPIEKMAQTAIDILVKKLNNPKTPPFELKIEPEFIAGQSCAFYSSSGG